MSLKNSLPEGFETLVFIRVVRDPPPGLSKKELKLLGYDIPAGYVFVPDPEYCGRGDCFRMPSTRAVQEDLVHQDLVLATAMRLFVKQTGIVVPACAFRCVREYPAWTGDHQKILFKVVLRESELPRLQAEEGGQPKFFAPDEFYETVRAGRFFMEHYEVLKRFDLILPWGRDRNVVAN